MADRLHVGQRVKCKKVGSFQGARGKVVSTLGDGEVVSVEFYGDSVLTDKRDYFETV